MWKIKFLNQEVLDELKALPLDQQAGFTWIADLIQEWSGDDQRTVCETLRARALGNSHERQGRYFSGALRHRQGTTGLGGQGIRQKNAEDTTEGNQAGSEESEGDHMTDYNDIRKEWMQDPEFVKEYEALEQEFSLASAMIAARAHADMTQQDVAGKMGTSQSYIARLEGGAVSPTMKALRRYAEATGSRVKITFEPVSS